MQLSLVLRVWRCNLRFTTLVSNGWSHCIDCGATCTTSPTLTVASLERVGAVHDIQWVPAHDARLCTAQVGQTWQPGPTARRAAPGTRACPPPPQRPATPTPHPPMMTHQPSSTPSSSSSNSSSRQLPGTITILHKRAPPHPLERSRLASRSSISAMLCTPLCSSRWFLLNLPCGIRGALVWC